MGTSDFFFFFWNGGLVFPDGQFIYQSDGRIEFSSSTPLVFCCVRVPFFYDAAQYLTKPV